MSPRDEYETRLNTATPAVLEAFSRYDHRFLLASDGCSVIRGMTADQHAERLLVDLDDFEEEANDDG